MIYYPRAISNTDSLLLFVLLCVLNVLLPQGNFCTPSFIIKFAGCFTVWVTSAKANLCTPVVSKLRCTVSAVLCQQSVNCNVLSVLCCVNSQSITLYCQCCTVSIVSKLQYIVSAVLCQQSVNYNVLSVMAMPTTLLVAIINCQWKRKEASHADIQFFWVLSRTSVCVCVDTSCSQDVCVCGLRL